MAVFRLTKTYCRNFCINQLNIKMPGLKRIYHKTCMRRDKHTTMSFSTEDYSAYYKISFMRWMGCLVCIIRVYDDDDKLIEDYSLHYEIDWANGDVIRLAHDSRGNKYS